MAASSPLHSDGSASRQPSSHSLHGITASNAALPSRKVEGLLGPLRPWSGSLSCGAPPRPRYTLCSHGSCADVRAKTVARGRTARVRLCPWILPPCRPQSVPRIKSARASKGVKRDRTCCPPIHTSRLNNKYSAQNVRGQNRYSVHVHGYSIYSLRAGHSPAEENFHRRFEHDILNSLSKIRL